MEIHLKNKGSTNFGRKAFMLEKSAFFIIFLLVLHNEIKKVFSSIMYFENKKDMNYIFTTKLKTSKNSKDSKTSNF